MVSGDAKWGAFYNCEASVLPSSQENFGIAVVENLRLRRPPVLISDQVNIWREIKEEGAGFVEPNSVAGTTQLFLQWNNLSSEGRLSMAARARPCFQRHFSVDRTCSDLLAAVAPKVAPGPAPMREFEKSS